MLFAAVAPALTHLRMPASALLTDASALEWFIVAFVKGVDWSAGLPDAVRLQREPRRVFGEQVFGLVFVHLVCNVHG